MGVFLRIQPHHNLDYGKGPRASITVGNMVYGLGAMGHAFCLDAKTGKKSGLETC